MRIDKMLGSLRRELNLWQNLTFDLMHFVKELERIGVLSGHERERVRDFRKLYKYLIGDDNERSEAEIKERAESDTHVIIEKKGK